MNFTIRPRFDNRHPPNLNLEDVLSHVPKGWHGLLTKGFKQMFDLGWDGTIVQIKEKFGSLRIYLPANTSQEIRMIVDLMENKTSNVCSECGEKATHTSSGWVLFYCEKHTPENSTSLENVPWRQ